MKIDTYEFAGQGMNPVYKNEHWMVGIKNWKPANDISGIDNLERHNKTDEMFALLDGSCTLVYANELADGTLEFDKTVMEAGKIYCIPAGLWHNTITCRDTKMALIEAPDTSMENSQVISLSGAQIQRIKELY